MSKTVRRGVHSIVYVWEKGGGTKIMHITGIMKVQGRKIKGKGLSYLSTYSHLYIVFLSFSQTFSRLLRSLDCILSSN